MIKKKKENGISVDLTGPEGNAFVLLGTLIDGLSKWIWTGMKLRKN